MLAERRCASAVVVGEHAAVRAARDDGGAQRRAVIFDPAVGPFVDEIVARAGITATVRIAVPGAHTCRLDEILATAAQLNDSRVGAVLAIGGGSALDHAKLANAVASSPGIADEVRAGAQRSGLVALSAGHRCGRRIVAIPTTVGTGSEVSCVACVDEPSGRSLVAGAVLQPGLAALDPRATASLPRNAYVEGVFEVLLRVVGPYVGAPSHHPLADASARSLLPLLADQLDRGCPGEVAARLTVAGVSHETHNGWLLRGRGRFPSPLWYVANELALLAGCRKVPASLALLGPWLERACLDGGRWGRSEAAFRVLAELNIDDSGGIAQSVRERLEGWAPGTAIAWRGSADAVAQRSIERWGGRLPMLLRFSRRELTDWVADALSGCRAHAHAG